MVKEKGTWLTIIIECCNFMDRITIRIIYGCEVDNKHNGIGYLELSGRLHVGTDVYGKVWGQWYEGEEIKYASFGDTCCFNPIFSAEECGQCRAKRVVWDWDYPFKQRGMLAVGAKQYMPTEAGPKW